MKHDVFVGVDPGAKGAIAWIGPADVGAEPFTNLNQHQIWELFRWLHGCYGTRLVGYIESVNAYPKQGVVSSFRFGEAYGLVQGYLVAAEIPFERVSPAKWQSGLNCRAKGDKRALVARAAQLFPGLGVVGRDTADALLIAEYCRRTWVE